MGGTESSNYVNNVISNTTDILINQSQDCFSSSGQTQQLILNDCTIKGSEFNLNQASTMDTTCVLKGTASVSSQAYIQNSVAQQAQSETQGMGLSKTDASNFIQSSIDLAQNVTDVFSQTMSTAGTQMQGVDCTGSTIEDSVIDMNQLAGIVSSAYAKSDAVVSTSSGISSAISQTATAKQMGILAILVRGLVLIAIIIVVIVLGTMGAMSTTFTKIMATPSFWMLLCAGLGALNLALAHFNWWPYNEDMDSSTKDAACIGGTGAALLAAAGIGYVGIFRKKGNEGVPGDLKNK